MSQLSLTGEPPLKSERSQWFTPMWLCRLLVQWVPPTARVLEPSCGSGNMIAALLERGHDPGLIVGVEMDPEWAEYARKRLPGVEIYTADFFDYYAQRLDKASACSCDMQVLAMEPWDPCEACVHHRDAYRFDCCVGNPPFEDNIHERFTMRCLELAPMVNFVLPVSIEFSRDRDHDLWAKHAKVVRRAKLPDRVKYGGKHQASFDSEAIKIVRREAVREPGEILIISEEVWTRRVDAQQEAKGTDSHEDRTVQRRTGNRAHSGRTRRKGG
jgi:SAM-dependent methyltransferase